jgi:TfoX/Sxy family transcriptional regulator of competence genes
MARDVDLADRIRRALKGCSRVSERKMFGGVAFMIRGHMACGTVRGSLMVRLGEEGVAAALKKPHVEPMDFTGKVIRSMAYVRPPGIRTGNALKAWVDRAAAFALTLPPKEAPRDRRDPRKGGARKS